MGNEMGVSDIVHTTFILGFAFGVSVYIGIPKVALSKLRFIVNHWIAWLVHSWTSHIEYGEDSEDGHHLLYIYTDIIVDYLLSNMVIFHSKLLT